MTTRSQVKKVSTIYDIDREISDLSKRPKVVLIVGVFDTPESMYSDYPNFLKGVKGTDDHLIVGVFSDEFVARKKTVEENISSFTDRAQVLLSLEFVGSVISVSNRDELHGMIRQLRPDAFIITSECVKYTEDDPQTFDQLLSQYTKTRVLGLQKRLRNSSESLLASLSE